MKCNVHIYIFDLINLFALQIFYAFNFTHLCLILLINWIPHMLFIRLCRTMKCTLMRKKRKSFNEQNLFTIKYFRIKKYKSFFSSTQPELLAVAIIVDDAINIFCVLSIFTFVCISINVLIHTLNMNSYIQKVHIENPI